MKDIWKNKSTEQQYYDDDDYYDVDDHLVQYVILHVANFCLALKGWFHPSLLHSHSLSPQTISVCSTTNAT